MHLGGVDEETYKLDELADKAGTSARTVRYYVQRGLLPGPAFRGRDTAYRREHLVRLRAIRKLQERFLPLDAIQSQLEGKSLEELEQIADQGAATYKLPPPEPPIALHPYRAPPYLGGARFYRWQLAPGLELVMADGAPAEIQTLAEEIQELVRQKQGGKWK